MISNIVYIFLLSTLSLGHIAENRSATDYILCRTCGQDVSSSNFIILKSTPLAHYIFNDTLFDKWEEMTSWFPGYRWKPCVCPTCGAYIGFVFEPIDHTLVETYKRFYGLILTSLISENFLNSLSEYTVQLSSD